MQITVALDPAVAVPGMLADNETYDIVSYPAGEDLQPGRLVELVAGVLRHPQGTTLGAVVGVVQQDPTRYTGTPWAQYDVVPVVRKGRVWAVWNGGTATDLVTVPKVKHASTDGSGNAQYRGDLSSSAASVTAGAEITQLPAGYLVYRSDQVANGMIVLEINIP